MSSRTHYWTCSAFADWLRGTAKPVAATSDGWSEWKEEASRNHPIRYWLAEEGLDKIQDFIYWPADKFRDIKYYINNRWVTRTHALTASSEHIPRGEWRDVGNRFLPCLFNELVDFVEIEVAGAAVAWGGDEVKAKYKAPFWALGPLKWRTWRCPQAGIENLEWQAALINDDGWGISEDDPEWGKPTQQAMNAREILTLYRWWKEEYPSRPDPYDASGWTQYCVDKRAIVGEDRFFSDRGVPPELAAAGRKALDLAREIEERYEQEDEAMLHRLVKVRRSLWT